MAMQLAGRRRYGGGSQRSRHACRLVFASLAGVLCLHEALNFAGAPLLGRLATTALEAEAERKSSMSPQFLAVKDAVYAALFGAPDPAPGDGAGLEELSDAVMNSSISQAQAVESFASRLIDSFSLEEAAAALGVQVLEPGADAAAVRVPKPSPERGGEKTDPRLAAVDISRPRELEACRGPCSPSRTLFTAPDGSDEPRDFFLFIKDYSWSLRYRISRLPDADLDTERPLLLEWVKLRRPVQEPSELLEVPSHELFQWDVVEPPRNNGFMYQVTQVVGSGVEAVINFFKDRGPKLLIQQDGISLVNDETAPEDDEQAGRHPRQVTHCWVQCLGLPFLPVLQYIAFFDSAEVVTDWRA